MNAFDALFDDAVGCGELPLFATAGTIRCSVSAICTVRSLFITVQWPPTGGPSPLKKKASPEGANSGRRGYPLS